MEEILKDILTFKSAKSFVCVFRSHSWGSSCRLSNSVFIKVELAVYLPDFYGPPSVLLSFPSLWGRQEGSMVGKGRKLSVQTFACHDFEKVTQFLQKENRRRQSNPWSRQKSFHQLQKLMSWKWPLYVKKLHNIKYFSVIQILLCQ